MDRTVASMTTEQLYRKRALDRENQRALRARKQNRVQELESEVADLKQEVVKLKQRLACAEERVQRSQASLHRMIESAQESLQTINQDGLEPLCEVEHPPLDSSRGLALRDSNTGLTLELPITPSDPALELWSLSSSFGLDIPSDAFSLAFLDATPEADKTQTMFPLVTVPGPHDANQSQSKPRWERLPLHLNPTCELDTVLLDVLRTSREQVLNSGQIPEVSNTSFPSIPSLLNPAARDIKNLISNAVGQHGKLTMVIARIPERIACLYYLCLYLRWLVSPTKRNFEAMPEFLRPIEAQLIIPHPIWIDTIVWPEAREHILKSMDWSEFHVLRQLTGETLSIHWLHDVTSILIAVSPTEMRFNPIFEDHIRQIKHWSIDRKICERFPFFENVPTAFQDS